ncbi:hypothetical protein [Vibrio sp. YYF0003]|uniref:hypothetical protein n=1 Tax=Vibrio sp. YYF0003 TaxID=3116646 RepID=UPI002ECCD164|nr:hypothetical protein [Vibrio sp. YYF0003]
MYALDELHPLELLAGNDFCLIKSKGNAVVKYDEQMRIVAELDDIENTLKPYYDDKRDRKIAAGLLAFVIFIFLFYGVHKVCKGALGFRYAHEIVKS